MAEGWLQNSHQDRISRIGSGLSMDHALESGTILATDGLDLGEVVAGSSVANPYAYGSVAGIPRFTPFGVPATRTSFP